MLSRTDPIPGDIIFGDVLSIEKLIDFEGVEKGRVAIAWNYNYLEIFKNRLILDGLHEDIDFHISDSGVQSLPFFLITQSENLRFEEEYFQKVNLV